MENDYPYTMYYGDDGSVRWECDICHMESMRQEFNLNMQRAARKHIMAQHRSRTDKCPTCGHEEVRWE